MQPISRRNLLTAAAAGTAVTASIAANAQTFGNPDLPPQGEINTRDNPASATDSLRRRLPSATCRCSGLPSTMLHAAFRTAAGRDRSPSPISRSRRKSPASTCASRAGLFASCIGIRPLRAYVSRGSVRVTTIDTEGRANVEDVGEGGLWYFPSGLPHSLQGIGEDGAEFILAFNDGHQTEYSTLLLSDWMAHTPPDILALNFGLPADTFAKIPLHQLYIFPGQMPGPLAAAQEQAAGTAGKMPNPSTFALSSMPPTRKTAGGEVRIADSRNFKASQTIAAALVKVYPGGLREMHWHPNASRERPP